MIHVRLTSDALGGFEEAFNFFTRGSETPVTLTIKGCVIGPTFELDSEQVDFGIVSYGFRWVVQIGVNRCSTYTSCPVQLLACVNLISGV